MSESSQTVAVVGASGDRSKFGNKAVRAYLAEGWTVVPVNPNGGKIEDLEVTTSLGAIKQPIDRITVYLPPAVTLSILPELAAAGAAEVWFNPGSSDEGVASAARTLDLPFKEACSIVDIGRSPNEFS